MSFRKLLLNALPALLLSTWLLSYDPAGAANAPAQSQGAAPAAVRESTLELAGLGAAVTVRRDGRGVPHIEAANDADLYFAQGYATAQDRLWQMDLLRRTARGELAEIFGDAVLGEDKRRRTYGYGAVAERALTHASAQTRASLEAYARGVNAYIESRDGKSKERALPPEFQLLQYRPRPWQPTDSVVLGKIFAELLSTTWQADLLRASLADLPPARREALLPEHSPLDVLVVGTDEVRQKGGGAGVKRGAGGWRKKPGVAAYRAGTRREDATSAAAYAGLLEEAETFLAATRSSLERVGLYTEDRAASNNWVVSGKRTASGKPLLANDPHLPASAPSIWHMAHLTAPGVNVAGVTAPGAPGIIIGHNESVAWGMTNLGPDVQDLYRERFNPERPTQYMTPRGWREAEVRREEVRVRKNPLSPETEAVAHEVTVTRHGPVVVESGGARYALRWTALDPSAADFDAFYRLNRARDWDGFRAALSTYMGPTQNFVYADTKGHIGYYGAGLIPVRRSGDGSVPYDGATDEGEWLRNIPFAELPHLYDPPSGLIVTANQRVVGRSYPHHLTHLWADPYRARRIYELLKDKTRLTADDFRAVQADVYSIGGATFAREAAQLGRAARTAVPSAAQSARGEDGKFDAAMAVLASWDGHVKADSHAAPLVAEMRAAFRRRILTAALGAERARQFRWAAGDLLLDRLIAERPADWLPKEFNNYGELVRACWAEAHAALAKRLGADESQWTWGRYSQANVRHPLAAAPLVGQQFAIRPFPLEGSGSAAGATPNVGASVSMRFIADTSGWDKTQQGIMLGQSGDPNSPHWADQLADWRAVTPRAFPFTARAVAAAAREVIVLKPAAK